MNNFKITKTILENIKEQDSKIENHEKRITKIETKMDIMN